MAQVESFYMGEGENNGEQIFNEFAKKHAHLFEGEFTNDESE